MTDDFELFGIKKKLLKLRGHQQSCAADSFSIAGMLALALRQHWVYYSRYHQNDNKSPQIPHWGTLATPSAKFMSSLGQH